MSLNTLERLAFLEEFTPKSYTEAKQYSQTHNLSFEDFSPKDWQLSQSKPERAEKIINFLKDNEPEKLKEILNKHQIGLVTREDRLYPAHLLDLYDPPVGIFYQGKIENFPPKETCLGVVGSRRASGYGLSVADKILPPLIEAGLILVSGLALGIDARAHSLCLRQNRPTISVLGSGLAEAVRYPRANQKLSQEIVEKGGLLISELPPLGRASLHSFPRRNRLIAAISAGVLVVEAAERSGSLITAAAALELGRTVFSLPHPIGSENGGGANNLLKAGALVVTESADIAFPFGLSLEDKNKTKNEAPAKTRNPLLDMLDAEGKHIDEIARALGISAREAAEQLTLLEINGLARHTGGWRYIRAA